MPQENQILQGNELKKLDNQGKIKLLCSCNLSMKKKMLEGSVLLLPLILYLLTSLIRLSQALSIIHNLFFLLVVSIGIGLRYKRSKILELESRYYAYFFLYFASIILLVQNTILLGFHGVVALTDIYMVDFTALHFFSSVYKVAFYLDLLGFVLFSLYFYYLQPSELKSRYRIAGLLSSVMTLVFLLFWRLWSGFYFYTQYGDWLSTIDLVTLLVLVAAQFSQSSLWYSYARLHRTSTRRQSSYLDNQVLSRTNFDLYGLVITALFLLSAVCFLIFLGQSILPPYSTLISLLLSIKVILIPSLMVFLNLNIFQKYHMLI